MIKIVFFSFHLLVSVKCCIPNRQVDATIPLTTSATSTTPTLTTTTSSTTTTTVTCPPIAGLTAWWTPVEIVAGTCGVGLTTPVSTCAQNSCAAGNYNYYTGTTISNPTNAQSIGKVNGDCCPNVCFCTSTGECFTVDPLALSPLNIYLIPYCSTPTACEMLAYLDGADVIGNQGTMYSAALTPFLIPNALISITCTGCPATGEPASSC